MRLIDGDKLKEELKSWAIVINKPQFYAVEDADHIIDCAPTISPVSLVKRGRWVKELADCASNTFSCSVCGHKINDNRIYSWETKPHDKYCGYCGALMED